MKQLFLKWSVSNAVVLASLGLVLWFNWPKFDALIFLGKAMVIAVSVIYFKATATAGKLFWSVDSEIEFLQAHRTSGSVDCVESGASKNRLKRLKHQAEHISFAANECPYWGLLGSVTGMYMMSNISLGGSIDTGHLQQIVLFLATSIGIAFVPTICGVFFRNVLTWQYHTVTHRIKEELHK